MDISHSVNIVDFRSLSVFVCYAHADNTSPDPRLRWLDRLLEFLRPLLRNENFVAWSDKNVNAGELWRDRIKTELNRAGAAVLLVSPAFLASDYIARSEVPVLLKHAAERGLKIMPLIISPCLYEEASFKYPDWRTGPHELTLGALQAMNPPSHTLLEMTEGEQNRVLLMVARQLVLWCSEAETPMLSEEQRERLEDVASRTREALKDQHAKYRNRLQSKGE
jgi:hypothetical protein